MENNKLYIAVFIQNKVTNSMYNLKILIKRISKKFGGQLVPSLELQVNENIGLLKLLN